MNPIHRRTLLRALASSLFLPLAGCGGGNGSGTNPIIDPPTRGPGSFAWRASLSFGPDELYSIRRMHREPTDNTLHIVTPHGYDGTLREYILNFDTGKTLGHKDYAPDSSEAAALLSSKAITGGLFRGVGESSLTRLDPATQQPLWTYTTEKAFPSDPGPTIHNPVVAPDNTVFLVTRNDSPPIHTPPSRIRALDGATGQEKWISEVFSRSSEDWGIPAMPAGMGIGSEGIIVSESGWKLIHPDDHHLGIVQALLILNPHTGRIMRTVPLFNARGYWRVVFPGYLSNDYGSLSPSLVSGPNGNVIGIYRDVLKDNKDSLVAIRTK